MRAKKTSRAISRVARRSDTDHRPLLFAALYLGAVILTFNAWLVTREFFGG